MYSLIDGLGLKYVYADSTGPMAQWFLRNFRHWFWSGDVILVIDDLRAHTAGSLDWLLHFDGEYVIDSEGGVKLTNGRAEAVVRILFLPVNITRRPGWPFTIPTGQYLIWLSAHNAG